MSLTSNRKNTAKLKGVLSKVVSSLLFQVLVALSFYGVFYFILNTNLGYPLISLIAKVFPFIYSLIKLYFLPFLMWFPIILFFIIELRANYRREKTIRLLLTSIQDIYDENETTIILPKEYSVYQGYFEKIKMQSVIDKQRVKEAEQKKNDLVVYLAHDLKTPLTSIIGYLTLLKEEKEISEQLQSKYQGIALDKAYRLEDLINEFFEITRYNLQTMELEKSNIDLNLMLQQLMDEFEPILAVKHLKIELNSPIDIQLNADANRLARVFDNLLKNAVTYCDPNTSIVITVKRNQDMITLIFANRGKKIPEHKLEIIFEKFYRLDESRSSANGGSGIGLAVAKKIIELHDGEISATSNDEITEFKVTLKTN